jgi:hypothetical protein
LATDKQLLNEKIALAARVPYWVFSKYPKPRWHKRPVWRLRALWWNYK